LKVRIKCFAIGGNADENLEKLTKAANGRSHFLSSPR
jgi:hypothetical protein